MHQATFLICTSCVWLADGTANDKTFIGQTVTQIPQPIQELLKLVISSCFRANRITSMPTWQFREQSSQAMHFSFARIAKRDTLKRVNTALKSSIIFASGHQ